jgi:serine/threonine protein kinase
MKTGFALQMRDLDGLSLGAPSRIAREYTLVRRLENSELGEQWLATRNRDQEVAVVTVICRQELADEHVVALECELPRGMRLSPHDNVARLLAYDDCPDRFVFATAHVDGDDLESLVEQTGPMPPDAAMDCIRQALAGLSHAHQQRLAHGNLALSDLVLDHDGVLKIKNFGCSNSSTGFAAAAVRDLRSLGAVLYWITRGETLPRPGGNGHTGNGAAAYPEPLATLFQRLVTAGNPQGFSSAAEALAFLQCTGNSCDVLAYGDCGCGNHDGEPSETLDKASLAPGGAAEFREEAPAVSLAVTATQSRAGIWLMASIAMTLAFVLALAAYLFTR